eukprot:gene18051-24568_t
MLARRKMRSRELAERVGITEQNISLLKSGKVRGVRFDTLERICEAMSPLVLVKHGPGWGCLRSRRLGTLAVVVTLHLALLLAWEGAQGFFEDLS